MLSIQLQAPDRIYKVGPEPIVINGMTSDPYKWPQTGNWGYGSPRSGIMDPYLVITGDKAHPFVRNLQPFLPHMKRPLELRKEPTFH